MKEGKGDIMMDWTIETEIYGAKVKGMTEEQADKFFWDAYKSGEISKKAYNWLTMFSGDFIK